MGDNRTQRPQDLLKRHPLARRTVSRVVGGGPAPAAGSLGLAHYSKHNRTGFWIGGEHNGTVEVHWRPQPAGRTSGVLRLILMHLRQQGWTARLVLPGETRGNRSAFVLVTAHPDDRRNDK